MMKSNMLQTVNLIHELIVYNSIKILSLGIECNGCEKQEGKYQGKVDESKNRVLFIRTHGTRCATPIEMNQFRKHIVRY